MTAIGNIGRETVRQIIDERSNNHEAGIAVGIETHPAIVAAIGVGAPSIDRRQSSRSQSGRSASPGRRQDLPYLPAEEYAKFKSELQQAQDDVYNKFYKRLSPSSSAKGQVRLASVEPAAPEKSLTDGEVRALRAAISGWHDDSDGDDSDPSPDV